MPALGDRRPVDAPAFAREVARVRDERWAGRREAAQPRAQAWALGVDDGGD
jgi:hypothetical protein